MTELSPAAQAVLDAVLTDNLTGPERYWARANAAAALRAVDRELASCLFVGPDEGDIKRVIDVSDLHNLIDELEGQ